MNFALVDLGSSSFYMRIMRYDANACDYDVVATYRQKVELRQMLETGHQAPIRAKAMETLQEFSVALKKHQVRHVKAVGTYTFRALASDTSFIKQANEHLGYPIEVISGVQEAQLIYQGVVSSRDMSEKHLLIDIGGGSTEVVIGHRRTIEYVKSFDLGCVGVSHRFFNSSCMLSADFDQAIDYATGILKAADIDQVSWEQVIGSSGSIKMIGAIVQAKYPSSRGLIKKEHLEEIKINMIESGAFEKIKLKGLRADRKNLLPGGLSIVLACFEVFGIESLEYSSAALREGVIAKMLGSF